MFGQLKLGFQRRWRLGGGGGEVPSNALALNGEPLTLNGKYLTLGPGGDMAIDILNPAGDGPELIAGLAALLSMVVDPATGRIGIGVANVGELQPGRLTIAPTPAGLGSELVTNGSFTEAATGWTLGAGWTYGSNKVTYTPSSGFGVLERAVAVEIGKTYRIAGVISGRTTGVLGVGLGGASALASSADGAFSFDLLCEVGGPISIGSIDDLFDGSVDDISVKEILAATAVALLHEDKSLALKHDTSSNSLGEPSTIKITSDDNLIITPGVYFGLHQNLHDGDKTALFDHYDVTTDRTIALPDADGTLALEP